MSRKEKIASAFIITAAWAISLVLAYAVYLKIRILLK